MFKNIKIGTKVVVLVLSLVFLAVLSESTISFYRTKESIKQNYLEKLNILGTSFEENVNRYFLNHEKTLKLFNDEIPTGTIVQLNEYVYSNKDTAITINNYLEKTYFNALQNTYFFSEIYIISIKGDILYQYTSKKQLSHQFRNVDHDIIDTHLPHFHINKPIWENDGFYIYTSYPIKNQKDEVIASIVCKIKTDELVSASTPTVKIAKSQEFRVFDSYRNEIYEIGNGAKQTSKISLPDDDSPITRSIKKENGKGEFASETIAKKQLVYYNFLPTYDLGFTISIDSSEAYYELGNFNLFTILIGIIILFIAFILSLFFAKVLTLPMIKLKKVLGLVSNGVLPRELNTPLRDEIGEMIIIVNKHVKSLKNTAAFAHAIGEGKFKTSFKPISNKDILGHALVNMRESLQKADKKDLLRNWIVSGNAEISEILRDNDSVDALGDEILEYICERINAAQGAFYIINDSDKDNPTIDIKASYAFNRKKFLKKSYKIGEGLLGQSAIEKDIIIRTEIPDDYMFISSGLLGDKKPRCLLIVPLIYNDTVYGLIELSSFVVFDEDKTQFMKEVSDIIARTIFNLKVNEETKQLLEESQRMSSELQVQQKELQQYALDMERAQDDLKEINAELETQINEVNKAQSRIQALLQNASEVITIYNEDKIIRYVSPSVETILGFREKDLINQSDYQHLDEESQTAFGKMFESLLENRNSQLTIELGYFKKTGDKIWLEATGKNMLEDPAIKGIIINYRDITERKRAEEEERKRGQMQALSENSPDLITRLSTDKNFFYINPTITQLIGSNPEDIINKNLYSIDLPEDIIESWDSLINDVLKLKTKSSKELVFPTLDGERIMQVNAIPEMGKDENHLETILLVSHDITDRKRTELEIQEKNKKINDSINYAEIIQETILPNTEIIRQHLPQSVVYFKPRDIVSGDFPWFYKKGDDVYLAAVDCTGHGVPGALISLVGYFLLNNIIENSDINSASGLLNQLDTLVTSTFRQNEESSKIKDGMDISMCKINMKENTIEYAGANRPLYHIKPSGKFNEIKGDKFPIGGGNAYGNKTEFTNHKITIETGDTFLFFSDGFPDQFGGEDGAIKYGPNRIKKVLLEHSDSDLNKLFTHLDNSLVDWMGSTKQTDDILMIGIKF